MTKILVRPARGAMPRVAPQLLPPEAAQTALNTRLLSGDLEAWREPGFSSGLFKSGEVRSLHLMARQHWLHWTTAELGAGAVAVDVARGPIAGDATERSYFSGTDAPRVTNLAKAIGPCGQQYPCDSLLQGVPAPEAVPALALDTVVPDASNVELTNAGAESGGTAGWIVDEGDLDVRPSGDVAGFAAKHGSYYFCGGTVARTEAHQTLLLASVDVFPQQMLELKWWQASGPNGSAAAMGLRFFDNAGLAVGEAVAPVQAVTPALGWVQRSVSRQVPATAHTVRLVMIFERAGAGQNDAWLDALELSAMDYEEPFDCSSFEGWSKGPEGGVTRVEIDTTVGREAPSWRFTQNNSVSYLYKDIGLATSPKARIEADMRAIENLTLMLYASASGYGVGINIGENGCRLVRYNQWSDEIGTMLAQLAPSLKNRWCRVAVEVNTVSASAARLKLRVTTLDNGITVVGAHEAEVEVNGSFIGFKSRSNETAERSWVDNVLLSVTAPEPDRPENIVFTNYVWTYTNEFGEEGPPSPVSRTVQRSNNAPVRIDTPASAPAGYGITHKTLYRSATGAGSSAYLRVERIPLDQVTYVDGKTDAELGTPLESQLYDLPPADLRGLLSMPNGFLAGFSRNELVFSAQGRYHAFPLDYRLARDYPIVAIGAIDASLVVLTESHPYVATGYTPDAMSMRKLESPQACSAKRSVAHLKDHGIVYAAPDGLVGINGQGAPLLLTEGLLTREQWQALNPASILGVAHDDRYFGFYEKTGGERGGFILDARNGGFGLVFTDLWAQAAYSDPLTDRLLLVMDNQVWQWEGSSTRRPYRWRSRLFQLPRPTAFGCAQVRAADYEDLQLTLYADGAPWLSRAVTSALEFVLPDRVAQSSLEIELAGTSRVQSVEVAEEMEELE